ncbi:MAG TPA: response regulator [Thermoplasmata archaeon]|nr:response regulator [Thermoplasmata archaeon]
MQTKVLAVDDESGFLELEQAYLSRYDLDVTPCESPLEAVKEVKRGDFDIVVSDYKMRGLNGIELLKILREDGSDLGFILFTGKGREDVAIEALNGGADYYIQKGKDLPSLFALLARMINEIHEAKLSERELAESRSLLRIANQRMDLLGAITRHDISGEITIADGNISLAEMETDPARIREHISKARNALTKIIGIIEVARTYQINGAMNLKWSSLHSALEHAIDSVDTSGVAYTNTAQECTILVDPLLEMVCANIFSNSIKHGVHVTSIRVRSEEHADGLDLIIEDDGIGITSEGKKRIFDLITPAGVPHGLSIAKRILEAEQIKIEETGVPGEGARFVLHFPTELYRSGRNNRNHIHL